MARAIAKRMAVSRLCCAGLLAMQTMLLRRSLRTRHKASTDKKDKERIRQSLCSIRVDPFLSVLIRAGFVFLPGLFASGCVGGVGFLA